MQLIGSLWQHTSELIRPKGSMEHLPCCLSLFLCLDNYNVNDWVLKEAILGCVLSSACAALFTWESALTLGQLLINEI